MNNRQARIIEKQNEELMLKTQFVARQFYNRAEIVGSIAWVICFASAASIFLPKSIGEILSIGIVVLLDLFALVFAGFQKSLVKKASLLREYFDSYVLEIEYEYKKDVEESIKGEVQEYCINHKQECDVQINNTGFDKPPGVKDWYVLKGVYSDVEVQFECQKQNAWWNKRLQKHIINYYVVLGMLSVVLLIACSFFIASVNIIRLFLSSAIVVKAVERIKEEREYNKISEKIEGAIIVLEASLDPKNVLALQKLINERRRCNIVGINLIHKRKASSLSENYQLRQ